MDLEQINWVQWIVSLEDKFTDAEKFKQWIDSLIFKAKKPKMKEFLRDLSARYPLKPHPMQLSLMGAVSRGIRFCVAPCGRRSGKTERAKRFLANMALTNKNMRYFAGAPTKEQATKIWWADLKRLTCSSIHKKKPNQTSKILYLDNGTEIHVISFDNPKRFEGVAWDGGIIDEIADLKPDTWQLNIYPALTTINPTRPNIRPWCWLIGVPEGLNHYYKIYEFAKSDTEESQDWEVFHWTTAEVLPKLAADSRAMMSDKQYNQEFNASFETANDRIYENYNEANTCKDVIGTDEVLHWMHDFNYSPMSSAVGVIRNGTAYILDEIVLEGAISQQSANEFLERYKDHKNKRVTIYGDASGNAGQKHGQLSNYIIMEDELRRGGWSVTRNVKQANPAIKDRHNSVRAKLNQNGVIGLYINPIRAKTLHEGLNTVQYKAGSTVDEQETRCQHITTALGYFCDYLWPKSREVIEKQLRTIGYG
jgi:hypothetical protein